MKINVDLEVMPFNIPNFVIPITESDIKGESFPAIPLRQIPANILSDMCDEFRKQIFIKADKEDPKTPGWRNKK